jgi:mannose-1-phosphate guanylyltransferase
MSRSSKKLPVYAVILAGGRGTRFWPRSRTRTPKQLLNIVGDRTMLQQTAARLAPLFQPRDIWVVTNTDQQAEVRKQLPRVPGAQILAEPAGRNTAAAIGLAAIHLARQSDDALMAALPADHYIAQAQRYRAIVRVALEKASQPGAMCVLGIPPTHPETGFGYIERANKPSARNAASVPVYDVRRFTEKPKLQVARKYLASGRYYWNAGMFFWRVSTFLENLKKFLPKTHALLMELSESIGKPRYNRALSAIYSHFENISVDYAILEPATRQSGPARVHVLPASIGWSDIGSWAAVYDLVASQEKRGKSSAHPNLAAGLHYEIDAAGNFLWSPNKFVAAIGIRDLVVVETPDALLICPRDRAQDVGKIVKWLELQKRNDLL